MATSATLTVNDTFSMGNMRCAIGTIAVTYDGSARTAAGETITHGGATISTEDALRKSFQFEVEIKQITCGIFKAAASATTYVGNIIPSTAKVVTYGGGAGTNGDPLDDGGTPSSDTFTANFIAIGK